MTATGFNTSIGMFIPDVPFLSGVGIAWQGAVIGTNGLEMTNAVSLTIECSGSG